MKRTLAALLALVFAVPAVAVIPSAYAQEQQQQQRVYAQQDLDRMLAPIALYPDALLSQVLMASTYPIEVVEAARWSRANPGLQGDAAVQAVQNEDWDPSVKSLVAFPQILQRMDENLEWTRSLGDAFLAQQPQLMDTVQQLRQRAQAAGNLQSNGQLAVQQQGQQIYIQPANPQVVYVPYYDPLVVYGPWWWPAYRPVAWAPWPGYVRPARPGVSVNFWWGAPIAVSASFFFGRADWHHHTVQVVHPVVVNRTVVVKPGGWRHDPIHRRGVAYRDPAVRQQFAAPAEQHRYQRPPGRDLHDSKVLSPQRSEERPQRGEERPQPRGEARPPRAEGRQQAQVQPRPHVQPQPHPQAQAQPRPPAQPMPRPHVQQEERRQAREEKRDNRQEARQEQRQERSHSRGNERS